MIQVLLPRKNTVFEHAGLVDASGASTALKIHTKPRVDPGTDRMFPEQINGRRVGSIHVIVTSKHFNMRAVRSL